MHCHYSKLPFLIWVYGNCFAWVWRVWWRRKPKHSHWLFWLLLFVFLPWAIQRVLIMNLSMNTLLWQHGLIIYVYFPVNMIKDAINICYFTPFRNMESSCIQSFIFMVPRPLRVIKTEFHEKSVKFNSIK